MPIVHLFSLRRNLLLFVGVFCEFNKDNQPARNGFGSNLFGAVTLSQDVISQLFIVPSGVTLDIVSKELLAVSSVWSMVLLPCCVIIILPVVPGPTQDRLSSLSLLS